MQLQTRETLSFPCIVCQTNPLTTGLEAFGSYAQSFHFFFFSADASLCYCPNVHSFTHWGPGWMTQQQSPHPIIPFPECVTEHQGHGVLFVQTLLLLLLLHIQEMSPWMESITSPRWHVDHFQSGSVPAPFSTSWYCSNSMLVSVCSVESLPAFHSSRFSHPLAFYFLISCLFLYIDCNVRLLFVVSFLPTFNLSVMFSMTVFE